MNGGVMACGLLSRTFGVLLLLPGIARAQAGTSLSITGLGERAAATDAARIARGSAIGDSLRGLLERFPEAAAEIGIRAVRPDPTRQVLAVEVQIGLKAEFTNRMEAILGDGIPSRPADPVWSNPIASDYSGQYMVRKFIFDDETFHRADVVLTRSAVVRKSLSEQQAFATVSPVPVRIRFDNRFGSSRFGPTMNGANEITSGCGAWGNGMGNDEPTEFVSPLCALEGSNAVILIYSDRYLLRRYAYLGDPPGAGWWFRLEGNYRGGGATRASEANRLLGVLVPDLRRLLTFEVPMDFLGSGTSLSVAVQGALPIEADVCFDPKRERPANAPRPHKTVGVYYEEQRSPACLTYLAADLRRLTGKNWRWVNSPWSRLSEREVWERIP